MSPEIRVLFDALPYYLQEQALGVLPLRAFNSPSGSATDQAARALFESEVRRLHATYVAEKTAQEAPAPSTRVVARSASPSSPWFPSTAPRTATPPPAPTSTLPADLDEAVAIAVDHARLAQRMGSPKSHVRTILRGYCATLFERPDVRREFGTLAELEALADYRYHGGVKPRD